MQKKSYFIFTSLLVFTRIKIKKSKHNIVLELTKIIDQFMKLQVKKLIDKINSYHNYFKYQSHFMNNCKRHQS